MKYDGRLFPILNDPMITHIPWAVIAPHEKQAQTNHSQSLEGLARRGGLDVVEAVLIIRGQTWRNVSPPFPPLQMAQYRLALMHEVVKYEKGLLPHG